MLVVMSYDVWLFLVIVLASSVAHFCFHQSPPAARAAHAERVMHLSLRSPMVLSSLSLRERDRRGLFAPVGDSAAHGLASSSEGPASAMDDDEEEQQIGRRPGVPFPAVFPSGNNKPPAVVAAQMRNAAMQMAVTKECCES